MLAKSIAILGTLFLAHAAYSTYEHLAYLKAVDRSSSDIPIEIVVECLLAAFVALVGVILNADNFKNVLMEVEIAKLTIDKIDTRPSFTTFNHRKIVSTHTQLDRRL
ncbi:magnesium transporter [Radiomyces spectabilis]|uniref:magnesium transporter n=1 Tax=Radiomyces spectabilis TaxID=64574 RepID=UPI002220E642|nr:magnesium transporter [Radiomyces spectabilis]KAI8365930.1 magnesium transporter [Radiomyces spectabilis]